MNRNPAEDAVLQNLFTSLHKVAMNIASEATGRTITDPLSPHVVEALRQPIPLAEAFAALFTEMELHHPPVIRWALNPEEDMSAGAQSESDTGD